MSAKSVAFFLGITGATFAGIYVVHLQQQQEREVRCMPYVSRLLVAGVLGGLGC